jgi:hypothetical protein
MLKATNNNVIRNSSLLRTKRVLQSKIAGIKTFLKRIGKEYKLFAARYPKIKSRKDGEKSKKLQIMKYLKVMSRDSKRS